MRKPLLATGSLLLALCLTPAAGATAPNPKLMVLAPSDLPTGFATKPSSGYVSMAKAAKDDKLSIAIFQKYGYISGYEADYDRDVSLGDVVRGAIEIGSTVSIYQSAAGPKAGLALTASACKKHGIQESVGTQIGDESELCSIRQNENGTEVRVYAISWRHGAVRGTVLIAGLDGGVSATQAVQLAKRQERRIERIVG